MCILDEISGKAYSTVVRSTPGSPTQPPPPSLRPSHNLLTLSAKAGSQGPVVPGMAASKQEAQQHLEYLMINFMFFHCPFTNLSTHPSTTYPPPHLFTLLPTHSAFCSSTHPSSAHPSVHLLICSSILPPTIPIHSSFHLHIYSYTHLSIHSFTQPHIHPPKYLPFTLPPNHPSPHSLFTHPLTYSLIHPPFYPSTHPLFCLSTYPPIHSSVYSLSIYLLNHPSDHTPVHLLIT